MKRKKGMGAAMKAVKKPSRKKSVFLRIALLAFLIYVLISLFQLHQEINDLEKDSAGKQMEINKKQAYNDELENRLGNNELYMEQRAYEEGYARDGDEIIVVR